ncbi:MAG: cadmium-translocating P-type ATPase [Lachnospiraceae bacterium]|nr:cadmium-translocating P-type ATPase [Lachnospiraceae bacterium]
MNKKQKIALIKIIVAALLIVVLELMERFLGIPEKVMHWLLLIPYFLVGFDVLKKAGIGIIHGQVFDENFLMTVATVAAIAMKENLESVCVMLFYQVGELFQSVAATKSRKNIAALMDIRPEYANVWKDGTFEETDPEEVPTGSLILVKAGEKIPIDGVVEEGEGSLDTSALTGESIPRDVRQGDTCISGCVNLDGVLKIRTTKEFEDSTVSRILELVENSSMKKAKTENFITKFAHIYTPVVCLLALALAVGVPLVRLIVSLPPDWIVWITRACTFLVISCPCALVISIPLSFFGGIGGASAKGILIKGGSHMEVLAKTRTIVFDKTGTLTKGAFSVTEVLTAEGITKEELLYAASYAECYSNHPIARSIRKAYGKEIDEKKIRGVEETSGHGIIALVDGKRIAAGNEKLMELVNAKPPLDTDLPGTYVHVARDGVYLGCIVISDTLKEDTAEALAECKKIGIARTVMLTGDNERAAAYIAKQAGIDDYYSSLLPEDKVAKVEALLGSESNRTLAFVGDGINDAPVLMRSDTGIAMGAFGSDAAIEAADVVLMDDSPKRIPQAVRIARKTMRIVYENIIFAIGAKVVFLVLGALGIAGMWWAIFADVGVMIIAVLNAIRCLR